MSSNHPTLAETPSQAYGCVYGTGIFGFALVSTFMYTFLHLSFLPPIFSLYCYARKFLATLTDPSEMHNNSALDLDLFVRTL